MSQFEQLKKLGTVIVADTGELDQIKKYLPEDATTNPSLVLKALKALKSDDEKNNEEYNKLIKLATEYANKNAQENASPSEKMSLAVDRLACEFGKRILEIVPGYVSTELDARLSFDTEASVKRALQIMKIYEDIGVKNPEKRVLIKIACTWEGFQTSKQLENTGIKTNLTLLFSIWQAAAAAQVSKSFLISPFVGRITDWHKKAKGVDNFKASEDPGVLSVQEIFSYYKKHNFNTVVMGASFRNKDQILELAGVDRCTIGPQFLKELQECNDEVKRKLPNNDLIKNAPDLMDLTEKNFRWGMCQDACATEKLAEGIRSFAADTVTLESILQKSM